MSRFALVGKEVYELVLERRLLVTLLIVSAVFTFALGTMLAQPASRPASPTDFLGVVRYAGPVLVGLLAIVLAGDAVARERQDRTLHLLFTAPATRTRYWAALLIAHVVAFGLFAALLLLFSILAGAAMGWVAAKAMLGLLFAALLPLFLTVDLLILASSSRFSSGRTSLLVAVVIVLVLWLSGLSGPFGWALKDVPGWGGVSSWHPFDLASSSTEALLQRGVLSWMPLVKSFSEAVLAGAVSWVSIATREVGR